MSTGKGGLPPFGLIIRGPLGAGKTTVAREVGTRRGAVVLAIDEFVESDWDGGTEALFLRANAMALERARPVWQGGGSVIFDGNFYWRSAIEDLVRRTPVLATVVTLELPVEECIRRDAERAHPYGETAAREVYEKVGSVCLGHYLDARGTVEEVVARVSDLIDRAFGRVRASR